MLCRCRRSILTSRDKKAKKRWKRGGREKNESLLCIVSCLANLSSRPIAAPTSSVRINDRVYDNCSFSFRLFSLFAAFLFVRFSFVKETRARLNGDYITERRRTLYTYVYEVNPCESGAPFEVNI